MHVRVARLPSSPLSLHFGSAVAHVKSFRGSFEGVRVNLFGRVVQARAHPGE